MNQQSPFSEEPAPIDLSRPLMALFCAVLAAALGYVFIKGVTVSMTAAVAIPILVLVAFLWSRMGEKHIPALLIAMFACLPFQQSLTGGESAAVSISTTDCIALLLVLVLPMVALRHGRLQTGPVGLPMFIFFSVALISSIVFWSGLGTANSLFRMFMVTLVAVLVFANAPFKLITAHRCFWAYLVAINVLTVFSLLAFLTGGFRGSEFTLGINKNALGPTFGCGVVIAVGYLLMMRPTPKQRIWLILTLCGATLGMMLSFSRGGWIATGAGYLLVLLLTRNFKAFVVSFVVLGVVIAGIWHLLPNEAKDYALDVSSHSSNIHSRLVSIDDVMKAFHTSPIIGVGVGLRKQLEPHNVLILTLGETGVIGLVAFIGMFLSGFYTFFLALRATRGDPQSWPLVVIGAAMLLVSLTHGLMDVYWRRGVGFMGWSSVGIAANLLVRKRRQAAALNAAQSASLAQAS